MSGNEMRRLKENTCKLGPRQIQNKAILEPLKLRKNIIEEREGPDWKVKTKEETNSALSRNVLVATYTNM